MDCSESDWWIAVQVIDGLQCKWLMDCNASDWWIAMQVIDGLQYKWLIDCNTSDWWIAMQMIDRLQYKWLMDCNAHRTFITSKCSLVGLLASFHADCWGSKITACTDVLHCCPSLANCEHSATVLFDESLISSVHLHLALHHFLLPSILPSSIFVHSLTRRRRRFCIDLKSVAWSSSHWHF